MAPFSKKIEDCTESLFHVVVLPSVTLLYFCPQWHFYSETKGGHSHSASVNDCSTLNSRIGTGKDFWNPDKERLSIESQKSEVGVFWPLARSMGHMFLYLCTLHTVDGFFLENSIGHLEVKAAIKLSFKPANIIFLVMTKRQKDKKVWCQGSFTLLQCLFTQPEDGWNCSGRTLLCTISQMSPVAPSLLRGGRREGAGLSTHFSRWTTWAFQVLGIGMAMRMPEMRNDADICACANIRNADSAYIYLPDYRPTSPNEPPEKSDQVLVKHLSKKKPCRTFWTDRDLSQRLLYIIGL